MPPEAITALTALIGAVGGGLGVTWVTGNFGHKGKLLDDDQKLRKELWDEIHDLRNRVSVLSGQNEICKRDNARMSGELGALKVEHRELQKDFDNLRAKLDKKRDI